jgi:hypothetical protein
MRHDPGNKALVIIVKDRLGNCAKELKRMNMSIQPGFGVRRRICANIASIAVRQIKSKKVRLLLNATDHKQSFAEVGLSMARRMAQRHRHLFIATLFTANVVFDDRVSAGKSAFAPKSLKYAFGGMALFAWSRLVLRKPLINLIHVRIQLRAFERDCAPIAGRFRIGEHLQNTISANAKIMRYLAPTLKMRPPHP